MISRKYDRYFSSFIFGEYKNIENIEQVFLLAYLAGALRSLKITLITVNKLRMFIFGR